METPHPPAWPDAPAASRARSASPERAASPLGARGRRAAYAAAGLALLSAALSAYWTLGGTLLLDTVGGAVEDLARTRSLGALAIGLAATAAKAVSAALALALVPPSGKSPRHRLVVVLNALASAALVLWGGLNVLVGGFVLAGAADAATADKRALRWHVFLWDLWFLVWGLLLAIAVIESRHGFLRAGERR